MIGSILLVIFIFSLIASVMVLVLRDGLKREKQDKGQEDTKKSKIFDYDEEK